MTMLYVESTYLTVQEVAARLRVHEDSVRRWLTAGELRGVRLPGRRAGWRISEKDLADFLERRRQGEEAP